jgi:selenide,water dikinase
LLAPVRLPPHPDVLVSTATADDAGVVRIRPDLALVQTVDFFPPMVDDPVWFGRVGAANSLSDVYAMGGVPVGAVCVFALPEKVPDDVPSAILNGAIDKLEEAGTPLLGGHTVKDVEIKFGLAVTGTIHPDRIVSNAGARPGDVLVLTKPLGTGYLCTALKRGVLSDEEELRLMETMAALNREAAEAMLEAGAHAATDLTGFGLLGHAAGVADASRVTLRVRAADVPWMAGLERHIARENTCGGLLRNMEYAQSHVRFSGGSETQRLVLADPQTSGGMMIAVAGDRVDDLLRGLERRGVAIRAVIGDVVVREDVSVEVV